MIWFTLALFAVSFVLTALLTPKPELEDARADSLDPENFPRASEAAPVPLLLGCARIKGPNTIWYGEFRAKPIKEKVKTGIFSSDKVVVGYQYFLTIDLGLCLGPNVELKTIFIDDVAVEAGIQSTPVTNVTFVNTNNGLDLVQWSAGVFEGKVPSFEPDPVFFPAYELQDTTTDFDLVADLGWDTSLVDLGTTSVIVSYQIAITATFTTQTPSNLGVAFYSDAAFNDRIFGDTNTDSMSRTDTSDGTFRTNRVETIVPAGARYMRIDAAFAPAAVIFATVRVGDTFIQHIGEGTFVTEQSFDIYEPELYGGYKEGGGHVGNVDYYPGNFNQTVNSYIENIVGVGTLPSYAGTSHIVLKNNNIGETAQLKKIEFMMGAYTDNLGNGFFGRMGAIDAPDIDPAEALYEIFINTWRGMGVAPVNLDKDSFIAASTTLLSENHGMSLVVSSSQNGKKVITEILRQIDGIMYQQTSTGKIKLRLIRNDYDPNLLPVYDEDDIIAVRSFQKTAWEDIKSQVKVTFSSRDQESQRVAIAQNMATANMLGGQIQTAELTFPFCYDADLANRLASRELSVLSTPLFKMTVQMNRSGYALEPGDVIKISWPEYGLTEIIMRVQKIDTGELMDNKVVVDLVQDIFAVADVVLSAPEDSSWVDERPEPEIVDIFEIAEMPYFYSSNLDQPIPDGNGDVIPFPLQPKLASTSFSFISGEESDVLEINEPTAVDYPLSGQLTAIYPPYAGFTTGVDGLGFTLQNFVGGVAQIPEAVTLADLRTGEAGILYANGEWMGYETVTDNLDGTYTLQNIHRGLFGTTPVLHTSLSNVYFFAIPLIGQGNKGGTYLEDDDVFFKILDQVGGITLDPTQGVPNSVTLQDIADRPLRPRNLQVDGVRSPIPFNVSDDPTFSLSWVSSSRNETEVTLEVDPSQTPDQTETYDFEVWVDGVEVLAQNQTGVTSPLAVDLTGITGVSGEIRLYSRRTSGDLKSSFYYAVYPLTFDITVDRVDQTVDTILVKADAT